MKSEDAFKTKTSVKFAYKLLTMRVSYTNQVSKSENISGTRIEVQGTWHE